MKLFKMFELEVRGPEPVGSHVDVDLNAVFSNNGRSITVRGFYDGMACTRLGSIRRKQGSISMLSAV